MTTPLDYEPHFPPDNRGAFWAVFVVAGVMTAVR
jgi:hypothetical protein